MRSSAWRNIDTEEAPKDDFDDVQGGPCCPGYSTRQENRTRGNWPSGIQGSLALAGGILGSSVIINSVPNCIRIYGLNFLAPYTIGLFLLSIPLFYFETIMGQFSSRGLISCWMVPAFKGVGVLILFVNIPHAVIQGTNAARGLYELHQGVKASLGYNITNEPMTTNESFNGTLAVALFIVWILVAIISCFGISAIAWVSTILVPVYIILMIILAALVHQLVGTDDMWRRWMDSLTFINSTQYASEATFAALTAGLATTGVVITYASYNRFHNDVIKDTVVVFGLKYFIDILLSVICLGLFDDDVNKNYTSPITTMKENDWNYRILADVFEKMAGGPSYAIAFFMMVFFMALLHVMALLETFVTSLLDEFPRYGWLRSVLVVLLSVALYLSSFTMCSVDYRYWETMLWHNVIVWAVHLIILMMCGCFLVYGILTYFRYRHDVASMTQWHLWCIRSLVPWWGATVLLLTIIPWTTLVSVGAVATDFDIERPSWSSKGVERTLLSLYVMIPIITFIVQFMLASLCEIPTDWRTLLGVTPSWMPALGKHWDRVEHYRNTNKYSSNEYNKIAHQEQSMPLTEASTQRPVQGFYI